MKTDETLGLERRIYQNTKKQGVFGCFEVTIGWFGKERVDYLTYDTKGIWRCYEIKVSLADFRNSKNNTFVGHYNYYVMPQELYDVVKDEIPSHIGVYTHSTYCVKRAKKQELKVDEDVLKKSLIRSLSREVDKKLRSGDSYLVESLERRLRGANSSIKSYRKKYLEAMDKVLKLEQEVKDSVR